MNVQGLANFLDSILGGLQLIALSILLGSLFWAVFMLRVRSGNDAVTGAPQQRCITLLHAGAIALAIFQALKILSKVAMLTSALGEMPWAEYARTVQFQAGITRIVLALAIAFCARRLARDPASRTGWNFVIAPAVPLIVAGAWLVHAVGRFDQRPTLMALTVLHQVAAAVWVGGVAQLLALWRLARTDATAKAFWPVAVSRFSALGIASVSVLVLSGAVLTWRYVGSWDGLAGTGYGSLALAKVFLLIVTLGFAALNLRAGRAWVRDHRARTVTERVPYYIEAETFLLMSILFVAATLSSQPPAVDIPKLTATVAEVLEMFSPKLPHLTSPTHDALIAGEAGRVAVIGRVPSIAAVQWSDYNHNVAGVFLLAMSALALLSYVRGLQWARYWPLGFVGLATFLFFRADAEAWPLGPIGFWESMFGNGEVLQHRLATVLALALGVLEMRARTRPNASRRLRFMFPVLCAFGGVLLVTHAHVAFEIRTEYLIQSTHLTMGLLAVIMAAGRWLELRFDAAGNAVEARAFGLAAVSAMLLIGLVLIFYREPLY